MIAPFLLDTNTYYLFFQPSPKPPSYIHLEQKLKLGSAITFYISEITSMEIHSVLGKYRRRAPKQIQKCDRKIIIPSGVDSCSHTWIFPERRPLKAKVFRDIQKMIRDIEAPRGDIQATVLSLNQPSIDNARKILMQYADRYNLGSHDALILGCLLDAGQNQGLNLTLVTSDKALKTVLKEEGLYPYDPQTP